MSTRTWRYPLLILILAMFFVGCAHKREAHYPSSKFGSEPPLIGSDPEITDKGKSGTTQARRSSSSKASSSQARLDADDPDRFDFDQVRD